MGLFLSNFKLYNLSIVIFNLFYIIHKYNPPTRIELVTFALQVQRSTTELRRIYEVCEKKIPIVGFEPTTTRLKAERSNQLSYMGKWGYPSYISIIIYSLNRFIII